jgi:hypothetical protein
VTDRHAGYIVILDKDIREDDAEESVLTALRMIRGVADVQPVGADPATLIAAVRRDSQWSAVLLNVLEEMRGNGRR